ncbi:hypothetical protein [Treponema sp. J25]|uniref:hypothetical protein n=1 Tax=Treponema sp. J25 TaxID=2094121 RepID=UPI001050696F|nr:hypothetical protein [Treponema sp. J25]TCW60973.1 hypothetical protein C5O22_08855 [Treponema sp. J25]
MQERRVIFMLSLWIGGCLYAYAVSPKPTKAHPAAPKGKATTIQEASPFIDFHVKSRGAITTNGTMQQQFDLATQIRPISFLSRGIFFYTWSDWTVPQEVTIPIPNVGLFHGPTGSRFLFGNCTIQGLESRITNPMGKDLTGPFSYRSSTAILATSPSSSGKEEWYGKIVVPLGSFVEGTSFVHIDAQNFPWGTYGTGVSFLLPQHQTFAIEGLYYRGTVEAPTATTWFSAVPLLPAHPFEVWAGTLWYRGTAGSGGLSLAYSSTYFGETGWYMHGAVRYAPAPWELRLAGDGILGAYRSPGGELQSRNYRLQSFFGYIPRRPSKGSPLSFSEIGWSLVSQVEGNSDTLSIHTIKISGTVRDNYRRFFFVPQESTFSYKRVYTDTIIQDTYSLSIVTSLAHLQIRNTLETWWQSSSPVSGDPALLFKDLSEKLTLAYRWQRIGFSATTLWRYRFPDEIVTGEYTLALSAVIRSFSLSLEGTYTSPTNTYEATLSWRSKW